MTHQLFSSCVYEVSIDNFDTVQDEISKAISSVENFTSDTGKTGGMQVSDEGIKNTNNFIKRYKLQSLEKEIIKHSYKYLEFVKCENIPQLDIFMSWLSKIDAGSTSSKHFHHPNTLVGVYYYQANNQGNLRFFNPNKHSTFQSDLYFDLKTTTGNLLLFPGWLEHQVLENTSNKPRLSIAFNIEIYDHE